MKVAFGTVAYESAWKYMTEFCTSLNTQTDEGFTVLIVCDNLSSKCLSELSQSMLREAILTEVNESKTIPALRAELLKQAKRHGFDLLILGDFDDVFSEQRVGAIKRAYACSPQTSFFYNEIRDFEGKNIFSYLPQRVADVSAILECNFLGLSNTAVNLHKISWELIDSLSVVDTPTFDWYLYSRLLLYMQEGLFVEGAGTFYRIHDNNTAGIATFEESDYKKELGIKEKHYELLKQRDRRFESLSQKYKALSTENSLFESTRFRNRAPNGYWWELIKIGRE